MDGSGLSISELLEKYFFNSEYHTSCSVVLQRFHNNSIEYYSMVDDEQTKYIEVENKENLYEANELSQLEAIEK
jgi:hypothetical protein